MNSIYLVNIRWEETGTPIETLYNATLEGAYQAAEEFLKSDYFTKRYMDIEGDAKLALTGAWEHRKRADGESLWWNHASWGGSTKGNRAAIELVIYTAPLGS